MLKESPPPPLQNPTYVTQCLLLSWSKFYSKPILAVLCLVPCKPDRLSSHFLDLCFSTSDKLSAERLSTVTMKFRKYVGCKTTVLRIYAMGKQSNNWARDFKEK